MPGARHWYSEFWTGFGTPLVKAADLAVTVSPPLAAVMAAEYGRDFATLPNCASRADGEAVDIERKLAGFSERRDVVFLYQGAFVAERGIDRLISAWQHVDGRGILLLRGPDNDFRRQMMNRTGRARVARPHDPFPAGRSRARPGRCRGRSRYRGDPVRADSINNRLCCPNKLSQYLAAGLPVISNELEFVKSVVVGNGIGFAVDFATSEPPRRCSTGSSPGATISRRWRVGRASISNSISIGSTCSSRCGEILPGWKHPSAGQPEAPDIDLGWIDDPNAMRAPASEVLRSAESNRARSRNSPASASFCCAPPCWPAGGSSAAGAWPRRAHPTAIRVRANRLLPVRRGYAAK